MDELKFMKEFRRFCDAKGVDANHILMFNSDEVIVNAVKNWLEENPHKTNFDKLRDVFPEYCKSDLPCPMSATRDVVCGDITRGTSCKVCKKLFWESEYKEDKK